MLNVHATCIVHDGRAVLIRGPSGAGKSDLALRLIDGGAVLVADDRTLLHVRDGRLFARPAPAIAGMIEVRGVGLVAVDHAAEAAVHLVCDLVPGDRVARMPEPETATILDVPIRRIHLCAFHAGTAAAIRLLLTGAQVRHPAPMTV
jgi:HPr kinase/phosphorylase